MKKTIFIFLVLLTISCSKDEMKTTEPILTNNCKRVFSLEYSGNKVYANLITEDEWNSLGNPGLGYKLNIVKIEVTGKTPIPKLGSKVCL